MSVFEVVASTPLNIYTHVFAVALEHCFLLEAQYGGRTKSSRRKEQINASKSSLDETAVCCCNNNYLPAKLMLTK